MRDVLKVLTMTGIFFLSALAHAEGVKEWQPMMSCANGALTMHKQFVYDGAKYGTVDVWNYRLKVAINDVILLIHGRTDIYTSSASFGESIIGEQSDFYRFEAISADRLDKVEFFRLGAKPSNRFKLVVYRDRHSECIREEMIDHPYDGVKSECVEWKTVPLKVNYYSEFVCFEI